MIAKPSPAPAPSAQANPTFPPEGINLTVAHVDSEQPAFNLRITPLSSSSDFPNPSDGGVSCEIRDKDSGKLVGRIRFELITETAREKRKAIVPVGPDFNFAFNSEASPASCGDEIRRATLLVAAHNGIIAAVPSATPAQGTTNLASIAASLPCASPRTVWSN